MVGTFSAALKPHILLIFCEKGLCPHMLLLEIPPARVNPLIPFRPFFDFFTQKYPSNVDAHFLRHPYF